MNPVLGSSVGYGSAPARRAATTASTASAPPVRATRRPAPEAFASDPPDAHTVTRHGHDHPCHGFPDRHRAASPGGAGAPRTPDSISIASRSPVGLSIPEAE